MTEGVNTAQIAHEQTTAVNESGVGAQKTSDNGVNWRRANETMAAQAQQIRELQRQIEESRKAKLAPSKAPDDYVEVKDLEGVVAELKKELHQLKTRARHGDVEEIINKYGSEVPPSIVRLVEQTGDLEAAVEACKLTPSYLRDQLKAQKPHPDAEKAIENAKAPKSASAVPGGTGTQSLLDQWKNMSRSERLAAQKEMMRKGSLK